VTSADWRSELGQISGKVSDIDAEDRRPEALFVVGPPDTGKTTWIDDHAPLHDRVYVEWTADPGPALAEAERVFKRALADGHAVVVESVSERDLYRRIVDAAAAGFTIRIKRTA